jgi:hypothetical protein
LVRGGELDPEVLHADAERYHSVYGSYGISVFALLDTTLEELAQRAPLVRFVELTLVTVDAVLRAGLRLEPTGRNPRHLPSPSMTWTGGWQGWPAVSTRSCPTPTTRRNLGLGRRCHEPGDRPGSRPQCRR